MREIVIYNVLLMHAISTLCVEDKRCHFLYIMYLIIDYLKKRLVVD